MRVFILGAGASKHAGFPLTKELVDFIKEKTRPFGLLASNVEKERNLLFEFESKIEKIYFENIELLLTLIDLSINEGKTILFLNKFSLDDLDRFSRAMRRLIAESFLEHHLDIQRSNDSFNYMLKFSKLLKDKDVIITFNWDCLLESALWRTNKWTFLDGWGINKEKSQFQHYPKNKPVKSKIKIFKLHGSFNWVSDDREIHFKNLNAFLDFYAYGEKDAYFLDEINLIEPSYVKFFRKETLSIWAKAFRALSLAEEIYVIGYSMPIADSYAQMVLFLSLNKNKRLRHIYFINPENKFLSGEMIYSYVRLFLRYGVLGSFHALERLLYDENKIRLISEKFEDWIEQVWAKEND